MSTTFTVTPDMTVAGNSLDTLTMQSKDGDIDVLAELADTRDKLQALEEIVDFLLEHNQVKDKSFQQALEKVKMFKTLKGKE